MERDIIGGRKFLPVDLGRQFAVHRIANLSNAARNIRERALRKWFPMGNRANRESPLKRRFGRL